MTKSPTQLTLAHLRNLGYVAAVVERWNPHVQIRQDLFGVIDVLAVGNGETVAVQSTIRYEVPKRIRKMEDDKYADAMREMRDAGWKILVHGWSQKEKGKPYTLLEKDIS